MKSTEYVLTRMGQQIFSIYFKKQKINISIMKFPPRTDLRNISEMVKVGKNIRIRENRSNPLPHMRTASENFTTPPLKQDFTELANYFLILFPLSLFIN